MKPVIISPRARRDLKGVWQYTLQNWSRPQADRYIRMIHATFAAIANGARPTVSIENVRAGYRKCIVGSHVVICRELATGEIDIIRILHERMDSTRHL